MAKRTVSRLARDKLGGAKLPRKAAKQKERPKEKQEKLSRNNVKLFAPGRGVIPMRLTEAHPQIKRLRQQCIKLGEALMKKIMDAPSESELDKAIITLSGGFGEIPLLEHKADGRSFVGKAEAFEAFHRLCIARADVHDAPSDQRAAAQKALTAAEVAADAALTRLADDAALDVGDDALKRMSAPKIMHYLYETLLAVGPLDVLAAKPRFRRKPFVPVRRRLSLVFSYTPPGEAPKYQLPQAQSPYDVPIAMYFGSKWSRLFDAQHHGLFDMRKRIAAKAPLWSYDFDDPSAYTRHEVDAGDALVVAGNCVQVGVGAPEGREDCFFLQCLLESRRASRAETDQVQFEFRDGRNLICEIRVALREPLTRAVAAGFDPFPHLPQRWLLQIEESIEGEHALRYSELRRAELVRRNLI